MVRISNSFGTVIRLARAERAGLDLGALLVSLGLAEVAETENGLVSVGPLFGGEASAALIRALEGGGLAYYDDFYTFEAPFPDWLDLRGCVR